MTTESTTHTDTDTDTAGSSGTGSEAVATGTGPGAGFATTLTDAVVDSLHGAADPRLRELLAALTRHLHAFVRETRPTMAEWERAICFLTATGQTCTDTRQEFILLSDVLGVSMLVETINGQGGDSATTESTVLGPFHMTESPVRENGANIDLMGKGEPCVVSGRVLSRDGTPLPGAVLDVWQADGEGYYDVQQPGVQPPGNGRGLFTADDQGRFWFRSCVPSPYPIPTDGPVGDLLRATARHPYRPAHIHFIASAKGHDPVTTHIFVAGSDYLDSDAVFAVKDSLVQDFAETDNPSLAREFGMPSPFRHARFDLVLEPLEPSRRQEPLERS
ncbi:intradiol ring-cleavage dioxygenase [Streptomyces sp. NPDC005485]|uniref:intradiol ring-cleavage dioxygenase n=1 Tax=Streptomyces sp. NPDC005485 TaxID=3155591 RepID=UPI0033BEC049